MTTKQKVNEDTMINGNNIPTGDFRKYFIKSMGESFDRKFGHAASAFKNWLLTQTGKTIKEALDDCMNLTQKTMVELLSERRFDFISTADKDFIITFNKAMSNFNFDCGGAIYYGNNNSLYTIHFTKTSTRNKHISKNVAVDIQIANEGLRLGFNLHTPQKFREKMKANRSYIENAPEHIKTAFTSNGKDPCTQCNPDCSRYSYVIDDKLYEYCSGGCEFVHPGINSLADYIELFSKFYTRKK